MVEKVREKPSDVMIDNIVREKPGVFKLKLGSSLIGELRITPEKITLSEICKGMCYETPPPRSGIFVNGEVKTVFDVQTLKIKEIRFPNTSYTASLEGKKNITITDMLIKDGEKFFIDLDFDLRKAVKEVKGILNEPLVKEDWERIRAMKKLK